MGILLSGTGLFAQIKTEFGAKAGMNVSSFSFADTNYPADSQFLPGFQVGVYGQAFVVEKVGVQVELLYAQMGSKLKDDVDNSSELGRRTVMNYILVPVMATLELTDNLFLEAGPQFGLLMGAQRKWDGTNDSFNTIAFLSVASAPTGAVKATQEGGSRDVKDGYKALDLSMNVGLVYRLPRAMAVNLRYGLGVSNISETTSSIGKMRNNMISLSLMHAIF